MTNTTTLVWFRSDLRTRDNTALRRACEAGGPVVGVFVVTPDQWRAHDWGDRKAEFVLRHVQALRDSLHAIHIPLRILTCPTFADVPETLARLCAELDIGAVYANAEYELNEQRRDEAARDILASRGVVYETLHDQVVLEPGSVRTGEGTAYTVYSPFARKWVSVLEDRGGSAAQPAPPACQPIGLDADDLPDRVHGFDLSGLDVSRWPIGETAAVERLQTFCQRRIDAYATDRDLPDVDGTSALSPYLAAGVLSPRQCLDAATAANGGTVALKESGAASWINELVWREFYKHIIAAFPRLCMGQNFKRQFDGVAWRDDPDRFEAWCTGRTGYPIVDAAMRQLNETGWMHNRLRMIAAMFLTKHLLIDWRLGERYFMQQLVDGDFASNNGGWQWSASTGTDAQPYFRVFNPWKQSERFDTKGGFIRRYVPELRDVPAAALHDPVKLGKAGASAAGYPAPIVEHAMARQRAIDAFKGV